MDIDPKEVESIKTIGSLYDSDVKLVKTLGGFYLAVGKKKKNSKKPEALGGASHQAIIAHQLCKEFGSDFQPAIFKSEHDQLEKVEEKTTYLPKSSIQKGVELYTLSKGSSVEFVLCKYGTTLAKYAAEVKDKELLLKHNYFDSSVKGDKEVANALAKAMKDKAYELGLSSIKEG